MLNELTGSTTVLLEFAEGRNDRRKYFMLNIFILSLHKRMLPDLAGFKPATS